MQATIIYAPIRRRYGSISTRVSNEILSLTASCVVVGLHALVANWQRGCSRAAYMTILNSSSCIFPIAWLPPILTSLTSLCCCCFTLFIQITWLPLLVAGACLVAGLGKIQVFGKKVVRFLLFRFSAYKENSGHKIISMLSIYPMNKDVYKTTTQPPR